MPLGLPAIFDEIKSGQGIIPSGLFGGSFDLRPFLTRALDQYQLGAFGLSDIKVGMSGEVERARLDILERMKRTTDSRAQSRLTLPKLFGDGKKETNILADVL
jgi:hypothetical protein